MFWPTAYFTDFSLQTSIKYAVCPGATKLFAAAGVCFTAQGVSSSRARQVNVSCCPLTSGEGDPPDPPTHFRGVLLIPQVAVVTVPARQDDSMKR